MLLSYLKDCDFGIAKRRLILSRKQWRKLASLREKVKQLCNIVYFASRVLIEISLLSCPRTELILKKNCGYLSSTYVPGTVSYINSFT